MIRVRQKRHDFRPSHRVLSVLFVPANGAWPRAFKWAWPRCVVLAPPSFCAVNLGMLVHPPARGRDRLDVGRDATISSRRPGPGATLPPQCSIHRCSLTAPLRHEQVLLPCVVSRPAPRVPAATLPKTRHLPAYRRSTVDERDKI
jgi:hypothetical protein